MVMTIEQARTLYDRDVVGTAGDKIGSIDEIFVDDDTGRPEWILLNRGFLGLQHSLVPVAGSRFDGKAVRVPFTKDIVADAPDVDTSNGISEPAEERLYDYYSQNQPHKDAYDGDSEDIVLSEEQLDIRKVRRPTEVVRLKKRATTEDVDESVPVTREEARIVREPVSDPTAVDDSDDAAEMILHEEDVKTSKRSVPKERVRLEKEATTENRHVDAKLRKEAAEVEREDR